MPSSFDLSELIAKNAMYVLPKTDIKIAPEQKISTDGQVITNQDITSGEFWEGAAAQALTNLKNVSGIKSDSADSNRNSVYTDAKSTLLVNINYLLNNSLAYSTNKISNITSSFNEGGILGGIASIAGEVLNSTGKSWLTAQEAADIALANYDTFIKNKPAVTIKEFYTKSSSNGSQFDAENVLKQIEYALAITKSQYKVYPSDTSKDLIEDAKQKRKEMNSVGYLYIKPITSVDDIKPVRVPFEFNPKISEGSLSAKYSATSFLSRVGEVQNYTGTGSTTLSISTSYEVMSDGSNTKEIFDDWFNMYTPEYLDKVEAAYRSLVFPYFKEENNSVTYIRPPVIKVVLYESNEDISSYDAKTQMEFAYPKGTNTSVFLKSQASQFFKQHKSFVATSVTISKNEESKNFYIKDKVIRYSGFDVELNLVEVTEDYTDVIPDFITYYNRYKGLK